MSISQPTRPITIVRSFSSFPFDKGRYAESLILALYKKVKTLSETERLDRTTSHTRLKLGISSCNSLVSLDAHNSMIISENLNIKSTSVS